MSKQITDKKKIHPQKWRRNALAFSLVTVITLLASVSASLALPFTTRPAPVQITPYQSSFEQTYEFSECVKKLGTLAEQKKQEALTKNCSNVLGVRSACAFFVKFIAQTVALAQQVYELLLALSSLLLEASAVCLFVVIPVVAQEVLQTTLTTMQASQPWWEQLGTNLGDLAMWLLSLFAPFFIATLILFGRQNLFVAWLISFFKRLIYLLWKF